MTRADRVWFWVGLGSCLTAIPDLIYVRGWFWGLLQTFVFIYTASLWARWQVDRAMHYIPNRRWWQ